jgi:hypothetical protein
MKKKFNTAILMSALTGAAIMASPVVAEAAPVVDRKCEWPQYKLKSLPQDNCSNGKSVHDAGPYTS